MKYNDFLAVLQQELKSYLDARNFDGAVNVRKVLKNNGVELDALMAIRTGYKAAPTIYLNCYYDEYKSGKSINEIIEEIYSMFSRKLGDVEFDIEEFTDFEKIKSKIAYKVINTEKNKKLLKKVPHIDILDLSVVFYCIVKCDKNENATTLIYDHHANMWNVTTEELYEIAKENTPKLLPYEIKSMEDIIMEMICEKNCFEVNENGEYNGEETENLTSMIMEELKKADEPKMYVLTNVYRLNGAVAMLYDGVLREFANKQQKDIIILPSSVHEVIIIPIENNMTPKEFDSIINEVNNEEVIPEEILSDHAYMYVRSVDEIIIPTE
ncbi:MAG: hypothetical protein E7254_06335 [Lachnospiraceae bacterium]|nr:hypothetical protein [Lachnospiraceae bacterium]